MAIPRFFRPALFRNSAVQILPIGIHTFNQLILPLSVPALDLFFSFNGGIYIIGVFEVNKSFVTLYLAVKLPLSR